jgi:RNA polymerase sigma-70 factor (ECF subfamily)
MDYRPLDDATLIRLIARADADALSELYDRYSRLVFSLALHTVGDPGGAEEITLDVFSRVWAKARTYQPEQARVSTWLTSIARYRAIDELRRRGVRPERQALDWSELAPEDEPAVDGPEPAFLQGYTHPEIAAALNQPLGTVKTRIRAALHKLRDLLPDEQAAG